MVLGYTDHELVSFEKSSLGEWTRNGGHLDGDLRWQPHDFVPVSQTSDNSLIHMDIKPMNSFIHNTHIFVI